MRPPKKVTDYYAILGVPRDASETAIREAYRGLAKKWHSDHHQSLPEHFRAMADAKLQEINEAKDVLLDPIRRAALDEALAREGPPILSIEPSEVDFGTLRVGEEAQLRLHVANRGGDPQSEVNLDIVGDGDWFTVRQERPADPERHWFDLVVSVLVPAGEAPGPRESVVTLTAETSKAAARLRCELLPVGSRPSNGGGVRPPDPPAPRPPPTAAGPRATRSSGGLALLGLLAVLSVVVIAQQSLRRGEPAGVRTSEPVSESPPEPGPRTDPVSPPPGPEPPCDPGTLWRSFASWSQGIADAASGPQPSQGEYESTEEYEQRVTQWAELALSGISALSAATGRLSVRLPVSRVSYDADAEVLMLEVGDTLPVPYTTGGPIFSCDLGPLLKCGDRWTEKRAFVTLADRAGVPLSRDSAQALDVVNTRLQVVADLYLGTLLGVGGVGQRVYPAVHSAGATVATEDGSVIGSVPSAVAARPGRVGDPVRDMLRDAMVDRPRALDRRYPWRLHLERVESFEAGVAFGPCTRGR